MYERCTYIQCQYFCAFQFFSQAHSSSNHNAKKTLQKTLRANTIQQERSLYSTRKLPKNISSKLILLVIDEITWTVGIITTHAHLHTLPVYFEQYLSEKKFIFSQCSFFKGTIIQLWSNKGAENMKLYAGMSMYKKWKRKKNI